MSKYILSTNRFLLREFNHVDAPHLYKLNLHPDVLKYTSDPPFVNIDEVHKFIDDYDAYKTFGFGRWSIIEKQTQQFVGWSGLKFILAENEVDVGYRILPEYWGKGIATETGTACCELGTSTFGLKRIVARIHKENFRSVKVAQKMKMIYEKDLIYDGVPWLNYIYVNKIKSPDKTTFINFNAELLF